MKSDQEQIKQALHHLGSGSPGQKEGALEQNAKIDVENFTDQAQQLGRETFQKAAGRTIKEGSSAKEALGLTDAMVEGIYGQAYRLYNTGKFKDASQIFRMLVMLAPADSRFLMGLAACHHMMKDYLSAINSYTLCSMIDGENPIPLYHASDCMVQVGDPASALIVLEMAVERSGERPEYKTLKDRALLTIESLKKEVDKIAKK